MHANAHAHARTHTHVRNCLPWHADQHISSMTSCSRLTITLPGLFFVCPTSHNGPLHGSLWRMLSLEMYRLMVLALCCMLCCILTVVQCRK
eukprot:jgi/Botrbrau1/6951/Bobra.0215s0028.1